MVGSAVAQERCSGAAVGLQWGCSCVNGCHRLLRLDRHLLGNALEIRVGTPPKAPRPPGETLGAQPAAAKKAGQGERAKTSEPQGLTQSQAAQGGETGALPGLDRPPIPLGGRRGEPLQHFG